MSTTNEIPITNMHDSRQGVLKGTHPVNPWEVEVLYTLETGHHVYGTERFRLKKEAEAFRLSLPKAPDHPTKAIFMDGKFWGVSVEYGAIIGGGIGGSC